MQLRTLALLGVASALLLACSSTKAQVPVPLPAQSVHNRGLSPNVTLYRADIQGGMDAGMPQAAVATEAGPLILRSSGHGSQLVWHDKVLLVDDEMSILASYTEDDGLDSLVAIRVVDNLYVVDAGIAPPFVPMQPLLIAVRPEGSTPPVSTTIVSIKKAGPGTYIISGPSLTGSDSFGLPRTISYIYKRGSKTFAEMP